LIAAEVLVRDRGSTVVLQPVNDRARVWLENFIPASDVIELLSG
jgi:hypothetical protein